MKFFRTKYVASAALLTIGALSFAGCSAASPEPSSSGPEPGFDSSERLQIGTAEQPMVWDRSLVEAVDTLDEVATGATLAVVAVAEGSKVETISDVPFTVTSVKVKEVVHGKPSASILKIRQFGDEFNEDSQASTILSQGKTYLLSLTPFELEPGVDTGQWVLVGGVSSWEEKASGKFVNDADSPLPTVISKKQFLDSMN